MGGSGAEVSRRWYYPYGEMRAAVNTPPTDRLYTGQRWEEGLRLYDYRARYYHPVLGRFISADTLVPEPGNPQALNRYAYVYNNPLRYSDPSGHWIETAWDIINIGWDIYEVYRDPGNAWNWVALAVDVGAAVLPAVSARAGLVVRGGKAAVEVASHADEAARLARIAARMEGFAGASPEVLRGVERLAGLAENERVPPGCGKGWKPNSGERRNTSRLASSRPWNSWRGPTATTWCWSPLRWWKSNTGGRAMQQMKMPSRSWPSS